MASVGEKRAHGDIEESDCDPTVPADVEEVRKRNKKRKKKRAVADGLVVLKYTPGKCKRKIKQLTRKKKIVIDSSTGCHRSTFKPNAKGYSLVHMGTRETKVLLHHVALRAVGRQMCEQSGNQVSHLCHDRTCCNPEHLHCESIEANNRRKGCPGPKVEAKCPRCEDRIVLNLCRHVPECVRAAQ